MTTEELLQAELDEAKNSIEALATKNKELLSEKKKLQSKYNDIDVDTYNKLETENEALKIAHDKLQKQYKTDTEKLKSELSTKDNYLQKTLIEDGLTKTLLENGIKKEFLKPAIAMLRNEVKLQQDGSDYKAIVGDKQLGDFVQGWVKDGDGSVFNLGIADIGAQTDGRGGNGGHIEQSKYFDRKSEHFSLTEQAKILKENPSLYNTLQGK